MVHPHVSQVLISVYSRLIALLVIADNIWAVPMQCSIHISLSELKYGDSVYMCVCITVGEACWWTIHPASKQRSEGEKVRIGDDLILVSLSSERYLVSLLSAICSSKL